MKNSPEFIFSWLGLWSIGAAPAMINYNLAENALTHCLNISGANVMLVDDDPVFTARLAAVVGPSEGKLPIRLVVMDGETKAKISIMRADRPADAYREVVKGDWPMCLFYTR